MALKARSAASANASSSPAAGQGAQVADLTTSRLAAVYSRRISMPERASRALPTDWPRPYVTK